MRMDANEIKQRLAGNWAQAIAALCNVDPSILDGKHHSCPKCGGNDRFNLDRGGSGGVFCNECQPGTGNGIDTVMWLNRWEFPRACQELGNYLSPSLVEIPEETRKIRHRVYLRLAKTFGIVAHHRQSLANRGLSEIEIGHRQYWSLVESPAMKLLKEFGEDRIEISKLVPGVMPGSSLTIAASNCLMIPVRNADGEIVGIQYRPDQRKPNGPKYLWLSSKDDGLPAISHCHFALPPADRECQSKVVRLTEGPLKADIATAISGIRTLAVAGVNSWKVGVAGVKSLSPDLVLLAFDSDSFTNPGVARAVVDSYEAMVESGLTVHLESWNGGNKGIDDALAAGVEVRILTSDETKKRIEQLRQIKKEAASGKALKNFKVVPSKSDNPNKAWDKEPILVPAIAKQLLESTEGWPKCCNGQLFVQTEDLAIRRFEKPCQLFGWIGGKMPVEFYEGAGCVTKPEFFSELPYYVESFNDAEEWPHFPPIEGSYYARPYEIGTGEYLEKFVDFFCPATEYDRELILGFIATVFWGGAPGRRVCFGIDSIDGTGAGKSELVKRVAKLVGGTYEFDSKEVDAEKLRKALINGERYRVSLLDNVKESCLSSAVIESMVTSSTVSGHRLNHGNSTRPNTITWAITMNGMSLSRDLAQRTVVIKLTSPTRTGTWDDDVDTFFKSHHQKIVNDVAAFFQRPVAKLSKYTRWSSWEQDILARLNDPDTLQTIIESRAGQSDEDRSTAEAIKEFFADQLISFNYDPEVDIIHIPGEVLKAWLVEATSKEHSQRSSTAYIKQLIDGGSIRSIKPNPCKKYGRGWLWNSTNGKGEVDYALKEKFLEEEKRKHRYEKW